MAMAVVMMMVSAWREKEENRVSTLSSKTVNVEPKREAQEQRKSDDCTSKRIRPLGAKQTKLSSLQYGQWRQNFKNSLTRSVQILQRVKSSPPVYHSLGGRILVNSSP